MVVTAEHPTDDMTFAQLLNEAWASEWQVSFLGVGTDDDRGWEVSVINWVTNRRVGMQLAELTSSSPLDALRAAIAHARDTDHPVWKDDGSSYGVWLYPGDDGYPDAQPPKTTA